MDISGEQVRQLLAVHDASDNTDVLTPKISALLNEDYDVLTAEYAALVQPDGQTWRNHFLQRKMRMCIFAETHILNIEEDVELQQRLWRTCRCFGFLSMRDMASQLAGKTEVESLQQRNAELNDADPPTRTRAITLLEEADVTLIVRIKNAMIAEEKRLGEIARKQVSRPTRRITVEEALRQNSLAWEAPESTPTQEILDTFQVKRERTSRVVPLFDTKIAPWTSNDR